MSFLSEIKQEFKDVYRYRYVVYSYVETNLRLRYRRSYLGFVWTVLAPLLNYIVLGLIFSLILHNRMENFFPYYFSGAIFFAIISNALNKSPIFLIGNEHFIKKIYLPKLIFVLNGTIYEFTNFTLSLLALVILGIAFSQVHLSWYIFFSFIPVALLFFLLIGLGSIISVATVYFRDLYYIVPVIVQSLFFMTPILYNREMIPAKFHIIIDWNPFYYFLESFRYPIINGALPPLSYYSICLIWAVVSFTMGIYIIKKFDNRIIFKL